MTTFKLLLCLL